MNHMMEENLYNVISWTYDSSRNKLALKVHILTTGLETNN